MTKKKRLLLGLLCAAAVGIAADEPSTQPTDRKPVRVRDGIAFFGCLKNSQDDFLQHRVRGEWGATSLRSVCNN